MRALVLVVALAACAVGRGRPLDTSALVAELGLDGAAEALRVRIAGDPDDVAARRALAAIEDRRGRPGAALAELETVRRIGGPLGARLDDRERARLAALWRERAALRAARGSPDALADLDRARDLVGAAGEDPAVRAAAERARALADLRHSDPERRAAGAARLGELDGLALWEAGARRAAFEALEAWERAGGLDSGDAARADAWLAARAWWRGPAGRPDLATLGRAIEIGASPCWFATAPGEHGCRASAVLGDVARERALLARARRFGWRTADPADAAAWVAITARAWRRGELRSWLGALDARVDLAALGIRPDGEARIAAAVPAWARPALLRAAGRADDAALALRRARAGTDDLSAPALEVLAIEAALAADDPAAVLSPAAPADDPLAALTRAFRRDAALADRVAEDLAARSVDVAVIGPAIAERFAALGDPARAVAWWRRAVASSPRDVTVRAGLVRALAAAGDPDAAVQELTTVAAGSGDAAAALLAGARALADAGEDLAALEPAKLALELTPPGDAHAVLALLIDLATRLDRPDQRAAFTAALAAIQSPPDPTTLRARALAGDPAALALAFAADPTDPDLATLAAAADPAAAAALLARAARWTPP